MHFATSEYYWIMTQTYHSMFCEILLSVINVLPMPWNDYSIEQTMNLLTTLGEFIQSKQVLTSYKEK